MSLDIWLKTNMCEHCHRGDDTVADKNITHNVTPMWELCGVYDALYMSHGKKARDTVDVLRAGVEHMIVNIEEHRKLNPPNGWGDADSALAWLKEWTEACEENPDARIGVWK